MAPADGSGWCLDDGCHSERLFPRNQLYYHADPAGRAVSVRYLGHIPLSSEEDSGLGVAARLRSIPDHLPVDGAQHHPAFRHRLLRGTSHVSNLIFL